MKEHYINSTDSRTGDTDINLVKPFIENTKIKMQISSIEGDILKRMKQEEEDKLKNLPL